MDGDGSALDYMAGDGGIGGGMLDTMMVKRGGGEGGSRFYIIVAVAVVVLVLLAVWWWWRRRKDTMTDSQYQDLKTKIVAAARVCKPLQNIDPTADPTSAAKQYSTCVGHLTAIPPHRLADAMRTRWALPPCIPRGAVDSAIANTGRVLGWSAQIANDYPSCPGS